MTTAAEIRKKINRAYTDVYVKRRLSDGTYEADWQDISRFILRSGFNIDYQLDSGDFDVGIFVVSKITMALNNKDGRFNDPTDSRSLWASFQTRHLTKVKVEAGYLDANGDKLTEHAFSGVFDERAFNTGDSEEARASVLSIESVFSTVVVAAGTLSSAVAASDAIEILCSRSEVTAHITVSAANINPASDITIDDPSEFSGKKLSDVLNDLLLATNSVLYVDADGNLIVKARRHTRRVKYRFRANADDGGADNVQGISGYNTGRQRVKNRWYWPSTSLSAESSQVHRERYGVTQKPVSIDGITNSTTRQTILNTLLAEWQFPKREFELTTDYLANELTFFDTVSVDVKPSYDRLQDLPISGSAVAGVDRCASLRSGLKIEAALGFKVIGITHDLKNQLTTLKLREIGNQINDGYLHMALTKAASVAFTAETTKDIDTSVYDMDAQYCQVEVLDTTGYVTTIFTVERPDEDTVRLTAAAAITGTFRVLLTEVEA